MKVASNGLRIHVEERGEGNLSLVFLHYWGGSSRTWKYVTAKLKMMAASYASREAVEATLDNVLTAKPLSAEDREQAITDSLRGSPAAKIAWPRATSLEDITAQVGAISVPTVVIAGECDRVDSPELLKAELLSRVPQAVMRELPGTGHLSMLESPDALVPIIEDSCRSLDGAAR